MPSIQYIILKISNTETIILDVFKNKFISKRFLFHFSTIMYLYNM